MKKNRPDYSHFLEEYKYEKPKDIMLVLNNIEMFYKLAELGVSNAAVILADITKALSCEVDGYPSLSFSHFETIYYVFILGYGYHEASIFTGRKWWKMRKEAQEVLEKILYVLGECGEDEFERIKRDNEGKRIREAGK